MCSTILYKINDQDELDITKNRDGHIFSHIALNEVSNKGLALNQISMKKMHKKYIEYYSNGVVQFVVTREISQINIRVIENTIFIFWQQNWDLRI